MSLPVTAVASHRVERRRLHAGPAGSRVGVVTARAGAARRSARASPATCRHRRPFAVALWRRRASPWRSWPRWRPRASAAARSALLAGLGLRRLGDRGARRRHAGRRPAGGLAALAVPAFSLVAFWLYSLGMHRAAVSSATAPLIVAQTFVPAAVGVALLGDGVRDGWWPAVVVGLVLATAGAVVLSVDRLRSPASAATGVLTPGPARRRRPSDLVDLLASARRRASPRRP